MQCDQQPHTPAASAFSELEPQGTPPVSWLVFSERKENNEHMFLFCVPFLPPASFLCLTCFRGFRFFFLPGWVPFLEFQYHPFCTLQALHLLSPTHSRGARLSSLFFFLGGGQIVQLEVGKGRGNRNQASTENRAGKEFSLNPVEGTRKRSKGLFFLPPLVKSL